MCLYPRLIRNKKYTKTKKNGGIIPAFSDNRVLAVPVGCGKCMECMAQERRKWQVRLLEDVRHNINGKCVTLTFSNESIAELVEPSKWITRKTGELDDEGNEIYVKEYRDLKGYELDNAIATYAVRKFCERWRKEFKKSIRHWFVTELGHNGTENVHMHGLIWTNENVEKIREKWKYGFIRVDEKNGFVNERTVNYITKYIGKVDFEHKEYKPKVLTSAGIGKGYLKRPDAKLNRYKERVGQIKTNEAYRTRTGAEMGMPTYWRNLIYTEAERERLWIEKLDEGVRYVNGKKIDISKGSEMYYKAVEQARKLNDSLGYGNDKSNWDRKEYEMKRRVLFLEKRLEGAKRGGLRSKL